MTKRVKRKLSLKKPLKLPRKSIPAPPPVDPFRDEPPVPAPVEPDTQEAPVDPYKAPEQAERDWDEPARYVEPEPTKPVAKKWYQFDGLI